MIVFDLDHTLFNTPLLKEDFRKVFTNHGLSDQDFWTTLHNSYHVKPEMNGCYSIEKHLRILNFSDIQNKSIKQDLEKNIYSQGNRYLYDDVIEILEKLKRDGERMVLVSKGENHFQTLKIKATNLDKYFKEYYLTTGSKIPILKKIAGNQKFFDINDDLKESNLVLRDFPKVSCILIKRPGEVRPEDSNIPVVSDLSKALDISAHSN